MRFPQGLADIAPLPEELSGAVNAIARGIPAVEAEARTTQHSLGTSGQ